MHQESRDVIDIGHDFTSFPGPAMKNLPVAVVAEVIDISSIVFSENDRKRRTLSMECRRGQVGRGAACFGEQALVMIVGARHSRSSQDG